MNKRNSLVLSLMLWMLQLIPGVAQAAVIDEAHLTAKLFSLSSAENGASFIQIQLPTTAVPSCTSRLVYIAPEDKHIVATMLTANAQNRNINIRYESQAAPVTLGSYNNVSLTCKALAVFLD